MWPFHVLSLYLNGKLSLESGPEFPLRTSNGHGYHGYSFGVPKFVAWLHYAGDDSKFYRVIEFKRETPWYDHFFQHPFDVYVGTHVAIIDRATNKYKQTYHVQWCSIKV